MSKSVNELAEMFAVALMARPRDEQLASGIVRDAFVYADAFVAERERRAAKIVNRIGRGECCCYSGCEDDTAIHQHADEPCPLHPDRPFAIGRAPLREEVAAPHSPDDGCAGCEFYVRETVHVGASCLAMGRAFGVGHDPTRPAAPHCPKRKPAAEALRFNEHGDLLNTGGVDSADTITDGYAAYRDDVECAVYVRATSREHAERMVAAGLAAMKAVK